MSFRVATDKSRARHLGKSWVVSGRPAAAGRTLSDIDRSRNQRFGGWAARSKLGGDLYSARFEKCGAGSRRDVEQTDRAIGYDERTGFW